MSTSERDELDGKQTILYFGDVWVRVKDARRIVDGIKVKLAEVTRERDEYYLKAKPADVRVSELERDLAQAREQLEAAKAEGMDGKWWLQPGDDRTLFRRATLSEIPVEVDKLQPGMWLRVKQNPLEVDSDWGANLRVGEQLQVVDTGWFVVSDRVEYVLKTTGNNGTVTAGEGGVWWFTQKMLTALEYCEHPGGVPPKPEPVKQAAGRSYHEKQIDGLEIRLGAALKERAEFERQVIYSRDELSRCQDHLSRVCQNLADEKIVEVSRESGIDNAVNRSLEAMRVIRCNRTEIKALQANVDRLRQQLTEQAPLVAIARELREALAESSMSICRNGDMCDSLMVEAVDADRLLAMLEKLRDAEGGA